MATVDPAGPAYDVGLMLARIEELADSSWRRSCWRTGVSYNCLERRHEKTTACMLTDFAH